MSKKRSYRISTIGSQVSTIVSVALVLLIVGIILTITTVTGGVGDALRQRVTMVVCLDPDAADADIDALGRRLQTEPYTSSVAYTSADEVLRQEMQHNAEILNALGDNPFAAEFEVFLKPEYVEPDSIVRISQSLDYLDSVAEVYTQADVVKSVSSFLHKATLVLSVVGGVLLVISLVLLFNTISLVIYSRRFIINTMQLVGARASFIRRPFVRTGIGMGAVAAALASLLLCGMHLYTASQHLDSLFFVSWLQTALVCAVLFVIGIVFCGCAAAMATNRFLNSSIDSLYKR